MSVLVSVRIKVMQNAMVGQFLNVRNFLTLSYLTRCVQFVIFFLFYVYIKANVLVSLC